MPNTAYRYSPGLGARCNSARILWHVPVGKNTGTFPLPTTTESDNLHRRHPPTHIFPVAPSQPGRLIKAWSDAVDDFLVEFGEASRLAIADRQPMVRTVSGKVSDFAIRLSRAEIDGFAGE